MKETFINEPEDMRWLREVHLPGLSPRFKSAVISGNEDYPSSIAVYVEREPAYDDPHWRLVRKGPGYMTEWIDPAGKGRAPVALEGRTRRSMGAVEGWAVTHDGETLKTFEREQDAMKWLHDRHPYSIDHAVRFEGYDIVLVRSGKVEWSYRRDTAGKERRSRHR